LEIGELKVEGWQLAVGGWRLAVGSWHGAYRYAVQGSDTTMMSRAAKAGYIILQNKYTVILDAFLILLGFDF
jgi:hypothetical protein